VEFCTLAACVQRATASSHVALSKHLVITGISQPDRLCNLANVSEAASLPFQPLPVSIQPRRPVLPAWGFLLVFCSNLALKCTVVELRRETDRQTDRQTDSQTGIYGRIADGGITICRKILVIWITVISASLTINVRA